MKLLLFILVILSAEQCSVKEPSVPFTSGKYTTHRPNSYIKRQYKSLYGDYFYRSRLMALDLKEDSTFRFSYCDGIVYLSGKWSYDNKIIRLYNNFNHYKNVSLPDGLIRYDENGYLLFPSLGNYDKNPGIDTFFTFLKINGEDYDGLFLEDSI